MHKRLTALLLSSFSVFAPQMAHAEEPTAAPGGPVSGNDAIELERMGDALHAIGDDVRATRLFVGVAGLGVGAVSIPVGYSLATADGANNTDQTIGYMVMGWGIGSAVGGVLSLALRIHPGEQLADSFDEMKERHLPPAYILAETERQWRVSSEHQRTARKIGGVFGLVIGGVSLIGGTLLLATDPSATSPIDKTTQHGFGAAFLGLGTLAVYGGGALLFMRSEVERSYEMYSRRKPVYGLGKPMIGGGPLPGGGGALSIGAQF